MNKIPFYRQLRFRIILLFSLVVFIGTAAGAFTMVQLADKQFREVLHDQFHNTIRLVENFFSVVGEMGRIGSNRFIHDERLLALQVQADREGTVARLDQLRQEISADVVIWLDKKGRVRHHSADADRHGERSEGG